MQMQGALMLCLACVLLSACEAQTGFVSSTGPAEDYIAVTKAQLATKRAEWRALMIRRYNITYEFVEDATKPAVVTQRSVVIRNNNVFDTRCAIGSCPVTFLKDLRLIPELFDLVSTLPERCMDQVLFNRDFSYPMFISANCTDDYPKPFTIRVASFAPDP